MKILKYTTLTLICVSMLVGGFAQMIAWNFNALQYNAYFQIAFGFGLMLWLSHKVLSYYDNRHSKPIVNARDKK